MTKEAGVTICGNDPLICHSEESFRYRKDDVGIPDIYIGLMLMDASQGTEIDLRAIILLSPLRKQGSTGVRVRWIPAFAGMTKEAGMTKRDGVYKRGADPSYKKYPFS